MSCFQYLVLLIVLNTPSQQALLRHVLFTAHVRDRCHWKCVLRTWACSKVVYTGNQNPVQMSLISAKDLDRDAQHITFWDALHSHRCKDWLQPVTTGLLEDWSPQNLEIKIYSFMLATTYLLYMWGAQCPCLIVNVVWDGWEWEWGQCTLVIVALREREREMCCHCQVSVGGALHCHHCHIDVVVVIASLLLCWCHPRILIVTISFLSHVFFLLSVVRRPYFSFAPSYQETNLYLLTFPDYSSPLLFPL